MKHFLSFLFVAFSFLSFSQAEAIITSPDQSICLGEDGCVSSSTSVPGSSPIINSIWSVIGPNGFILSGNTAPGENFCAPFTEVGTYNISLINQHQNGTTSQVQQLNFITVNPAVVADISASVSSCNVPLAVTYGIGGSSGGLGVTYSWTFESGNPATFSGANPPLITYASPGNYDVTIVVTNTVTGCTATFTRSMNVQDFVADFIIQATVCEGEAIPLTDNSTVGANSWSWSATPGAGVSGTANFSSTGAQNPTVSFTAEGSYTINLTSSNTTVPCNGSTSAVINVLPKPDPAFVFNPNTGCAPLAVSFTNGSAGAAGATFVWNFGDGTANFTGQTPPNHVYTLNGTFTPQLTMTASNGCSATVSNGSVTLSNPVANFTVDQKDGCEGQTITFTDNSTSLAPITDWFWTFGDGGTSALQNPTHVYTCGEYDVRLIIVAQGGCRDTVILSEGAIPAGSGYSTSGLGATGLELTYGTHTTPDFMVDHHNDCIKKEFELSDLTQILCPHDDDDVERIWVFNGQAQAGDSLFKKQFSDTMQNIGTNGIPGTDVSLIIDFRGCRDTTETFDSLYVSAPVSKFTVQTLFCDVNQQPLPLAKVISVNDQLSVYSHAFTASTLVLDSIIPSMADDDVVVTYRWGDGTVDLVEDTDAFLDDADKGGSVDPGLATAFTTTVPVTHTYTDYGSYEVWQVIENRTTGCADSSNFTVNVSWVSTDYVFDEVGSDDDVDSVCINNIFGMIQTSSTHSTHGPLTYSFNLDNGQTLPGSDPQTTFTTSYGTPGIYNIVLTTTNSVGCSATAAGDMTAFALPVANFTLDDVIGCVGVPYTSTATNTSSHPAQSFNFGNNNTGWATNGFAWSVNGTAAGTTNGLGETFPTNVAVNSTITLVVTDAFGCVSTPFSLAANVQQPTAAISLDALVCNSDIAGGTISSSGNGNLVSFIWTLDGVQTPQSAQSVIPIPDDWRIEFPNTATSETHTVGLIVFDDQGCSDTLNGASITILNPQAAFTDAKFGTAVAGTTNEFNCPPVTVNFTDASLSTGSPIVNWAWQLGIFGNSNFGENGSSPTITTEESPQGIQYLFSGTYDLRLIIQDQAGCIDTLFIDDYLVIQGPSGDPNITLDAGVCGQDYIFDLTNTTNVSSWTWDLGDGTVISSADEPDNTFEYHYNGVQTYTPVLTLYDDQGCAVPYDTAIIVPPNGVTASFTADPTEIGLGQTVTFNPSASTSTGGNLINWAWDFGDGSDTTLNIGSNVTNQYYIGGDVPVTLIVTDDRGCTDDFTVILTIDVDFSMPNVFHGVGTKGPNEFLNLFADFFKEFDILIVNRWGNVVYEGVRDPLNPRYLWDGIDMKSGKLCSEGTYFYKLNGILKNDEPVNIHGFVTLIASTPQ